MTKHNILVYSKPFLCNSCGTEFSGIVQAPDEGFGHAAILYVCSKCTTLYSHSEQDALYLGALEDKIKEAACPVCMSSLNKSLQKKSAIGKCPNCQKSDFRILRPAKETYVEALQLFR